jgi:hypothetical protein
VGITDRTRKLLWARSGNRCAICRGVLVMEPTESDAETIVGDECHIVARSSDGPRGGEVAKDKVDECSNLILLCKVDHKRVDDQPKYFTAERLQAIKTAHEAWVHTTLSAQAVPSFQFRIQKGPEEEKFRLSLCGSASTLIEVVTGSYGFDFDHDDLEDEDEADLVAAFLQELHDIGDIYDELESGARVRTRFELAKSLKAILEAGFFVYGGKLRRHLEVRGEQSPWPISVIRVLRSSNPLIHTQASDGATPPSPSPGTQS